MFKWIKFCCNEAIFIDNTDINFLGNELYHSTSTLFQSPDNQFVTFSVEDELTFALENRDVPLKEMKKRRGKVVLEYKFKKRVHHSPDQLSDGKKQLTTLASSLKLVKISLNRVID